MKKLTILATILAASVGTTAFAQQGGFQATTPNNQNAGFTGQQAVSKVSEASQWRDDQYVVLQGKIVKQIGKDDFIFSDGTGEIEIEVDDKAWYGQNITPADKIKVFGEVDKSWNRTEVEIHRIEKVK
ncbi:NirD/YgiW/YdeI family stress tolerance protein [Pelistega sp. NLN82]|uniref:NirD/YgiW/YdeI family stress tolerance protein n=1 Tax=Pelistega ratti TaxID=2652177 RepID=A0A6L9Y407_9BURK|nr:NirD/YgiW/YdeI family stress tolerance protein [Pelistega ratti]NEN75182.1 NirD/YgiW/YdeI family stress tolerance protein [Pelistega ratti]